MTISRPYLVLLPILVPLLAACPGDDQARPPDAARPDATSLDAAPPAATRFGSISIQDQSIHGVPQAGHGLSVRIEFTELARAPDFDEQPGQPTGCKAWRYDVATDPPPALVGDDGKVWIAGTSADVPHGCVLDGDAYRCPAKAGAGMTTVTPLGGGAASYAIAGVELGVADIGRKLRIAGDADHPGNTGELPIVAIASPTAAVVANPAAVAATFAATYSIVVGGGAAAVALDSLHDPILDGDQIEVGVVAGGAGDFDVAAIPLIDAGGAFALDTASEATLSAIPLDGGAFSLGCAGDGGACGDATISVIQLETTDGDVAGLSPFVLPPPARHKVVVTCAALGASGRIDVPAGAAELLRAANLARPITRIRTAFMRDGFAFATSRTAAPNQVRVLAGHQRVGFHDP